MRNFLEAGAELIGDLVFLGFWAYLTVAFAIMKPFHLLLTRRRFVMPRTNYYGGKLGLWWPYCISHFALKEDGHCPGCGRSKSQTMKELNNA